MPQKYKYAYLQYYYLCDFIDELNIANNTNYYINKTLKLEHYVIVLHIMVLGSS